MGSNPNGAAIMNGSLVPTREGGPSTAPAAVPTYAGINPYTYVQNPGFAPVMPGQPLGQLPPAQGGRTEPRLPPSYDAHMATVTRPHDVTRPQDLVLDLDKIEEDIIEEEDSSSDDEDLERGEKKEKEGAHSLELAKQEMAALEVAAEQPVVIPDIVTERVNDSSMLPLPRIPSSVEVPVQA